MKTAITVYVFMEYSFPDYSPDVEFVQAWRPVVRSFKAADDAESIFIYDTAFDVNFPDDFDPIPKQVAALETEKREAMDEYQTKVAKINERLSKLQAITYEIPA